MTTHGRHSQPEGQSSSSQSVSFWAEAVEAVAAVEGDLPPDEDVGGGTSVSPSAIRLAPSPTKFRFWNSLVSPDTSDIEPDDGPPPKVEEDDMDLEPPSEALKQPPSPPADALDETSLEYLPLRSEATGAHAYLASAEYAPNAFGDIADYMRKKKVKVQTQNADIAAAAADLDLPQIFKGITIYINGNTTPPMEVLRKMILFRGGTIVPFMRSKKETDFVVAPILTIKKFNDWKSINLVKEGWVVESCEAGRLLDWRRWRLRPEGEPTGDLFGGQRRKLEEAVEEEPASPDVSPLKSQKAQPLEFVPTATAMPLIPPVSSGPPIAATQSLLRPVAAIRTTQVPPRLKEPAKSTSTPITKSSHEPAQGVTAVAPSSPSLAKTTGRIPAADSPTPPPRREGAFEKYSRHESNPQAKQLMSSSVFRAQHTAERGNEAGFIDQYYQNSRLHHLSTWKAELRVLVAEARSSVVRAPTVLAPPGEERVILHVDFDAFFVNVGLVTRPHLRGRPVVVCHSSRGGRDSTSEIASASYEARAFGVRNGMSLGRATQLVGPEIETIPYDFEGYKRHSAKFYTVLLGYADELEAVSVDEALLDATGAARARALAPEEAGVRSTDPAVQVADKIRDDIRAATGCEVSIGISCNILLARLATRKAKPAGVFHLTAADAPAFLADLDVEELPSVGWSTRAKLEEAFGTTKCGALLSQSRASLRGVLGPKTGETIHAFLRGIDTRRLEPEKERKSVSAEMNYGIRFQNQDQAERYVRDLSAEVAKRLRNIGARGRQITLKLMVRHPDAPLEPPKFLGHGKCETVNKGGPLRCLTDDEGVIGSEAVRIFLSLRLDPVELRGVGIQITKLVVGPGKGQTVLDFKKPESKGSEDEEEVPLGFDPSPEDEVELEASTKTPEKLSELASTSLLNSRLLPVPPRLGSESPARPAPAGEIQSPLHVEPSSERMDPEFLAALPDDIRREVEQAHVAQRKRRRNTRHKFDPPEEEPESRKSGLNPAAHITRQLRPRLKTQLGARAIAELPLYGAWSRAGDRQRSESVDRRADTPAVSDSEPDIQIIEASPGSVPEGELRRLGIDPEVFAALPLEMKPDVLAEHRARFERQRTTASPSRPPKRRRIEPSGPVLFAMSNARPVLLGARETSDVADVLTRWVTSRPRPEAQDVKRVRTNLVKCVSAGIGGVDHVSMLLRCMRGVIADLDEESVSAWSEALEDIKAAVDAVLVARMGAPLRL